MTVQAIKPRNKSVPHPMAKFLFSFFFLSDWAPINLPLRSNKFDRVEYKECTTLGWKCIFNDTAAAAAPTYIVIKRNACQVRRPPIGFAGRGKLATWENVPVGFPPLILFASSVMFLKIIPLLPSRRGHIEKSVESKGFLSIYWNVVKPYRIHLEMALGGFPILFGSPRMW